MDKQYLVSFLATIQGDRMVVQGLRNIEKTQGRVTKTTQKGAKATQNYSMMMGGLVKRALMVIPVWLLLRTVFMGVIRVIGSMVEGYLDLEDGLARIQTVVHGTAEEVASDMAMIKNEIKDIAMKTRVPLKELTETFYFLKTASLTTGEAMSAFEHTVDAMTGTGIKGKEMARAVAGVYNTMGKAILEGASASEKFQKIADILTYTYATQDVQMNELIQGYTKLAPFTAGLSDSFSDLVTMIGWLNTKMLRAGRTGRLTARAFLQITKNADKLAKIFGVTFDPNEPLNFMKLMGKINDKIKIQGKLTAQQTEALRQVFATRALTPVQLIIQDYDDLVEAQKLALEEAENFAKRMAELRMNTVRGQMGRVSNEIKVLFEDMVSAYIGEGDMAGAMELLADGLENSRHNAEALGRALRFVGVNLSALSYMVGEMFSGEQTSSFWNIIPLVAIVRAKRAIKELGIGFQTYAQIVAEFEADKKKAEEEAPQKKAEALELQEMELTKKEEGLANDKREVEILKNKVSLMKVLGATAVEIARFRLETLEGERMTDPERGVQHQIRLNTLIREEIKLRESQKKVAADLYLQYAKSDELGREQIERMMELAKMTSSQLARTIDDPFDLEVITKYWNFFSEKQKQAMGEGLRREYNLDKFISPEAWEAKTKAMEEYRAKYWQWIRKGAPKGEKPLKPMDDFEIDQMSQKFGKDIPTTFAETWLERMYVATDKWAEYYLAIIPDPVAQKEEEKRIKKESDRLVDIVNKQMAERARLVKEGHLPKGALGQEKFMQPKIHIERIEVTAEGVTLEEIGEAVKEGVIEELGKDDTIRKIDRDLQK